MPFGNFKCVREVSSEDSVHLAENLIKSQPGKKWKTKNAGEKSAYVILEMSESQYVTGIDIGNEHSAFVEILVGKLTSAADDFQEILLTSSFMTPTESKSSNNINRVRCFNHEALVPTVRDNKWSLIKILCTQPFNKHVSYGLSFIKIHIKDEKKNAIHNLNNIVPTNFINKTSQVISALNLRENSPDSESENSSSLFNRWKKSKNDTEQTDATSMRTASKNATPLVPRKLSEIPKSQTSTKVNDIILDRNRERLFFEDDNNKETSNENQKKLQRLSEHIDLDKERRRIEKEKEANKKCKRKPLDITRPVEPQKNKIELLTNTLSARDIPNNERSNSSYILPKHVDKLQSSTTENPSKKIKLSKKYMPFNQLLKGVVLVISGIQNPERGDIRNKAIALGAKYKSDWDNACTHLICAFKNTPKYKQIKGKGKIVTQSWIQKCYTTRKYLPWRRYALDSTEVSKPESDEEIFEATQIFQSDNTSLTRFTEEESTERNNTFGLYDVDDNDQSKTTNNTTNYKTSSSDSDTDDEVMRIKQKTNAVQKLIKTKTLDIYDASTEEEDYIKEKLENI